MGRKAKFTLTAEEVQALLASGLTGKQIALRHGVTPSAVYLRAKPEKYAAMLVANRGYSARKRKPRNATKPFDLPENPTIEDYMLPRQRLKVEGLLPQPDTRTNTGKLLGDPLPGRSALDKLRSSEDA